MTNQHPITPPPELVKQWEEQFLERPTINGCFIQSYVATKAARWGADQELEACCDHMRDHQWGFVERPDGTKIHRAIYLQQSRRPKPPSLKEQARVELDRLVALISTEGALAMAEPIRRALEALDD
jgi:hypothetical protein